MRNSTSRWYLNYFKRPVLAFFYMPGSRGFGILLLVYAIILVASIINHTGVEFVSQSYPPRESIPVI